MAIVTFPFIHLGSRPRSIVGCVFVLALVVRLIFVVQWHMTPYGPTPLWDAQAYHEWAQNIAQGQILRDRAFYSFPLFPYMLGALYALFGHSLWIASLFNAVLGAATCALLAELSLRLFGSLAAIATGFLAALYMPLIFYTAPVLKEPLGLLLMALAMLLTYQAIAERKTILWAGLVLGLSALVRGNVLLLALLPLCVFIFERRRHAIKHSALYLLGIALAILPVTLHNLYVSHDFVLLSYAGGFNAYIGHGPMATGTSYEFPPNITDEEYDTTRIASVALGHEAKPSEVSAYWQTQAFDYAKTHLVHERGMLVDKLMAFWSNAEPFDNYDMRFIARTFPTVLSLPLPGFGLIALLAAFGAVGCQKLQRPAVKLIVMAILLYMLSLLPFYVTDRYRLPVVVFLFPLAGLGISASTDLIKAKRQRRLILACSAAFLMTVISFWPQDRDAVNAAYDWGVLSILYEDEGAHTQSLDAFDRSMVIDLHQAGPDVWIKHAEAEAQLGRTEEARKVIQQALILFPTDGSVTYNYGRRKYMDGDYVSARAAFEKAIRQTPTFLLSYRGLALTYARDGERTKALEIAKQGLAINPSESQLRALVDTLSH